MSTIFNNSTPAPAPIIEDEMATLSVPGIPRINLPVYRGSDGTRSVDVGKIFPQAKITTYDPSSNSTAATSSAVAFIDPVGDGHTATLQYRGYPIKDLAEKSSVLEVAYLLMHGELPDKQGLDDFTEKVIDETVGHQYIASLLHTMPAHSHPMSLLGTAVFALQAHYAADDSHDQEAFDRHALRIFAQMPILAAWVHSRREDCACTHPNGNFDYSGNYLRMMFGSGPGSIANDPLSVEIMSKILILHADHEQNASTTVVRNIRSTGSNLYAAISGGIGALWGPLHGGANEKVISMLQDIYEEGISPDMFIERAKTSHDADDRLMGFGHRVYKSYDPRADVMKHLCERYFEAKHVSDPLLQIALELEKKALSDEYFIKRKLYPNVDFYSGILMHGMGIPSDEFTVIFALGRVAGWLAQAREFNLDPAKRIARPRQVYTGELNRTYTEIESR